MGLSGSKPVFNKDKLKSGLGVSVSRIKQQANKKRNGVTNLRRRIAELIRDRKYESARIQVEQAIRDELYIEAIELVSVMAELLQSRLRLLTEATSCPPDLKEAVTTLCWACPRTDNLAELADFPAMMCAKFGREFVEMANDNTERSVNEDVYRKLSVTVPEPDRCMEYLQGVCAQFDLDWQEVHDALATSSIVPNAVSDLPPPPPIAPIGPPGGNDMYHPPESLVPPAGYEKQAAPLPPPQGSAPPPPAPTDDDLQARLDSLKRQ